MDMFDELDDDWVPALIIVGFMVAVTAAELAGFWPASSYSAQWSIVGVMVVFLVWYGIEHGTLTDDSASRSHDLDVSAGDPCLECGSVVEKIGERGLGENATEVGLCPVCKEVYP